MTDCGSFVACTHENLFLALRWIVIQKRLAQSQQKSPEVDAAAIQRQVQRIRTALDRVKAINRKVTDVRAGADDIQTEAEALRDDIRNGLATIEDALKMAATSEQKKSVVSIAGD
jgi:hypothetical protein